MLRLFLTSNRYNNKALDLSNPIRLSGLSSGAKLELVVLSRSPSVVSVALQLPESINHSSPGGRLTDRFPSSTSLWLILRKFESSTPPQNYTARSIIKKSNDDVAEETEFYESPVLSILGRELFSFIDLQKTLAQLGFNSGSVLLRLSFRASETPYQEMIGNIEQYFKSVDPEEQPKVHSGALEDAESKHKRHDSSIIQNDSNAVSELGSGSSPKEPLNGSSNAPPSNAKASEKDTFSPPTDATTAGPEQRPIVVYAPPSSTIPRAAQQAFNADDYEPSVTHAKLHQSRLANAGRNKPLLSDKELATQKTAQAQKLAEIKSIEIKIRFPDQGSTVAVFTNQDTARSLYDFVRGLLHNEKAPFLLNFSSPKGPKTVPSDGAERLISDLGMTGRILVNFIWDQDAGLDARTTPVLKDQYRMQAKEIVISDVVADDKPEKPEVDTSGDKEKDKIKPKGKGGVPKWLKLPGKK